VLHFKAACQAKKATSLTGFAWLGQQVSLMNIRAFPFGTGGEQWPLSKGKQVAAKSGREMVPQVIGTRLSGQWTVASGQWRAQFRAGPDWGAIFRHCLPFELETKRAKMLMRLANFDNNK